MRHSTNKNLQNGIFGAAITLVVVTTITFVILFFIASPALFSLGVLVLGPINVVFLLIAAFCLGYLKWKEKTMKVFRLEKFSIPL